MQRNSFRYFRSRNYNSKFARKWKKMEECILASHFSETDLCDVSNLSLSEVYEKIRSSLPESARNLLHLLILANTKLSYFKSGIRYSGRFVADCHKLYPTYPDKEKRKIRKERQERGWLTCDPIVLAFLKKIGKSPFYKVSNPVSPDQPIESYFSAQYSDLLNAMIDDAVIRYLSCCPKTSPTIDVVNDIFNRLASQECVEAVKKIIPFQQANKRGSIAENRIVGVALTSYFSYLYEKQLLSMKECTSSPLWHNSTYLPLVQLYLLHHPQNLLLSWKDISPYMQLSEKEADNLIKTSQKDGFLLQKIQAICGKMEREIHSLAFYGEKKEKQRSSWCNLQGVLLSTLHQASLGKSDLRIDFLNYFNAPYTARRQVSGRLASNYVSYDIPEADQLDIQMQITQEKFETITRLAQGEIDEEGKVIADYSDEGKMLNRGKFSKKTRVPIFLSEISFFTQSDKDLYNRISEQSSNFKNLWELFCLLQPLEDNKTLSSASGFNRSVALNAFNNLSGAVDLIFHTGIPESSCDRGFGAYRAEITFRGNSDNEQKTLTLVGYPFELWCTGLKTKFTMLKYGILASIDDVECINNIIDWIYNCLCKSNINVEQITDFEPYRDIYDFMDLLMREKRRLISTIRSTNPSVLMLQMKESLRQTDNNFLNWILK